MVQKKKETEWKVIYVTGILQLSMVVIIIDYVDGL